MIGLNRAQVVFLFILCIFLNSCAHQVVEQLIDDVNRQTNVHFEDKNKHVIDSKETSFRKSSVFEEDEKLMRIIGVLSNSRLRAISEGRKPFVDEKLAIISSDKKIGIYGMALVRAVSNTADGRFEFELEIVSLSQKYTVQIGDVIKRLDLSSEFENYLGRTDHLVVQSSGSVSSRYKALVTQGLSIGDTAETLWKDEFLFTYYGQVNYGLYDFLTVGTVVPLNAAGAANGVLKLRFYRSSTNIVSSGITYTKIPNSDSSSFNVNFMWDSISNNDLITHNFITLAVVSFNNAEDVTAIKSIGTSSLQTGYEFLMNDWSRILVGPNFNFEKKSVGGYFSYLKIWDKTHLQFSLNSTNIRSLKLSPEDGYYVFLDAYWRY